MTKFDENMEVLVIDDDADARNMLRIGLEDVGWEVTQAASGEEALQQIRHSMPDAVLLDVMMPGIDGFETCGQIRGLDENVPVIFMTGLDETEHIVRGFEVGGTDYVTKPVAIPVVIARLQSHTRVSRLVRATREALAAMDTAMLAHDESGVQMWANDAARAMFSRMQLADRFVEGQVLPEEIHAGTWENSARVILLGSSTIEIRRVTAEHEKITMCMLKPASAVPAPDWKPPHLTDRESEVLLWVARGKTNRDIGEILGMSPRTVNKHLEHIFEKLGVETRTAAAAAAVRQYGMSGS